MGGGGGWFLLNIKIGQSQSIFSVPKLCAVSSMHVCMYWHPNQITIMVSTNSNNRYGRDIVNILPNYCQDNAKIFQRYC